MSQSVRPSSLQLRARDEVPRPRPAPGEPGGEPARSALPARPARTALPARRPAPRAQVGQLRRWIRRPEAAGQVLAAARATWVRPPLSGLAPFRGPVPALPRLPLRRLPVPRVPLRRIRVPLPRPARLRLPRPQPAVLAAALAWIVVGIALFTVYLHMSRTTPVNSDGASNALQAWAMLHGNPLLRGWRLSDVSFYTTELPQYMLLEAIGGLSPDVVHLAGAMTYTLLVLAAAMLAKGRATGGPGLLRAGLAIGIMLAPQQNGGVYVLMLSPDHVGSTIPALLVWLLLDRAPRRWYVPVLAGILLTWALVADNIVLITGVAPLVAVAALRGYQVSIRRGQPLRSAWFEVALIGMAVAAVAGAREVLRLIAANGGFFVFPVGNQLATFSQLPKNAMLTLQGILLLFGANFLNHNVGYVAALAAAHLVGIGLVAWAVCAALRRLATADLAVQLLVASTLVSLGAYVLGRNATNLHSTREFTAVLPCGAALAGRLLARRLSEARLVPALAIVLTGYLLSVGRVIALPAVPAEGAQLATWLSARHLDYGLGGYWQSNVVTLDSGGQVQVRSVLVAGTKVIADNWETEPGWYAPAQHQATFVVVNENQPGGRPFPWLANVRATFGQPASISYVGPYAVLVWDKNLLTELPG
jgi:hypothetical protein